ncbi:MAG: hypothetical protein ACP5OU_05580 [Methanothrix sp.]
MEQYRIGIIQRIDAIFYVLFIFTEYPAACGVRRRRFTHSEPVQARIFKFVALAARRSMDTSLAQVSARLVYRPPFKDLRGTM